MPVDAHYKSESSVNYNGSPPGTAHNLTGYAADDRHHHKGLSVHAPVFEVGKLPMSSYRDEDSRSPLRSHGNFSEPQSPLDMYRHEHLNADYPFAGGLSRHESFISSRPRRLESGYRIDYRPSPTLPYNRTSPLARGFSSDYDAAEASLSKIVLGLPIISTAWWKTNVK